MPDTETPNADEPQDGVNRLLGMVVHEVSLVDRAANKRKFLVTKKDPMSTKPVKKDDNAASPAAPGGSAAPAKIAPMQAQVKDALLQALTSAAEKLVATANAIKEAETTDAEQTPPVPADVTGQIGEVASMLQGVQTQFGGAAAAPGEGAAPAKADLAGITDNGGPASQGAQKAADEALTKAIGLLDAVAKNAGPIALTTKVGEAATVLKALHVDVQKAGRKMAKERLERFRKALDLLAGIMKELALQKRDPKTTAAPVAKGAPMDPKTANELITKAEELTTIAKKALEENVALKTSNTTLQNEVNALKKGARPSNSLTVDGTPPAKSVAWPIDMNNPIAPKGESTSFARK